MFNWNDATGTYFGKAAPRVNMLPAGTMYSVIVLPANVTLSSAVLAPCCVIPFAKKTSLRVSLQRDPSLHPSPRLSLHPPDDSSPLCEVDCDCDLPTARRNGRRERVVVRRTNSGFGHTVSTSSDPAPFLFAAFVLRMSTSDAINAALDIL